MEVFVDCNCAVYCECLHPTRQTHGDLFMVLMVLIYMFLTLFISLDLAPI